MCVPLLAGCILVPHKARYVHALPAHSLQELDVRDELPQQVLADLEESVKAVAFLSDGIKGVGTAWWLGGNEGWMSAYHGFNQQGAQPVDTGYSLGVILQGELTVMLVTGCGQSKTDPREDWLTFQTPLIYAPQSSLFYDPRIELLPGETVYLAGRLKWDWETLPEKVTPRYFAFPLTVVKTKVLPKQSRSHDFVHLRMDTGMPLRGFSGGPAIVIRDGTPIVVGIYTHAEWRARWNKPVQWTHYVLRKRFP